MRVVSFLPAATEMVYALNGGDQLVGVTEECDFPSEARLLPTVVRSALPLKTMTLSEIDRAVSQRLSEGKNLYEVDERLLERLAPDVILTQDLCQVCAPSGNEITRVLKSLTKRPEVIYLTPKSLDDIFLNIRAVGKAIGRESEAERFVTDSGRRLEQLNAHLSGISNTPRVFCMEWLDPLYNTGHWVPEMVERAGGTDRLGRPGKDSIRIPWQDVLDWAPEIIVVSPCGFKLSDVILQLPTLYALPGWASLPAVKIGRVYAVDANSYFARPGPRVIDGIELLAHLFHPALFPWAGPQEAFQQIES